MVKVLCRKALFVPATIRLIDSRLGPFVAFVDFDDFLELPVDITDALLPSRNEFGEILELEG